MTQGNASMPIGSTIIIYCLRQSIFPHKTALNRPGAWITPRFSPPTLGTDFRGQNANLSVDFNYLGLVHLPREDVLLVVRHDDVPRARGNPK